MALYKSPLSRTRATVPGGVHSERDMARGMNLENLPPNLSTDPLDFFGAIRELVEQSIPQHDIKRYAPSRQNQQRKWAVDAAPPAAVGKGGESGLRGIVTQLEGENGVLRDRVADLERSLRKAQGCPPEKLAKAETARDLAESARASAVASLDKVNDDLRAARETAARDVAFQAARADAEIALARASSEASLAQLGEEFRLFREKAADDGAKHRSALEALKVELGQVTAVKAAHEESLERQNAEAVAARGGVDAALAQERESFRAFREKTSTDAATLRRAAEESLSQERERCAAVERESEEVRQRQNRALEEGREQLRVVRAKAEIDADALRVAEAKLVAEREKFVQLEREREARREEMAADLAKEREELRALREAASGGEEALLRSEEALAAERARCASLEREGADLRSRLERDLGKREEELRVSREETAGEREALKVSEQVLGAERARFEEFRLEAEILRKEEEAVALAARSSAEQAFSKERGEVVALRENAAEQRQALVESEKALTAERKAFSEFKKEAREFKEKSEVDAREACAVSEAAAAKGKKEADGLREGATNARRALQRSEEALAAERKKFASWKRTCEAKMELLRREATRAGDLEDQLASKALRLKQKEAETRALASDGNVVRGLRESLSCKDSALNELRQELGNLRIASVAAEAESAARLQHQLHQQRLSMGAQMPPPMPTPALASPGSRAVGSGVGGGGDMVRTLSMSSGDSFAEAVGLGAIAEAVEEEVEEEEEEEVEEVSSESESGSEEESEEEENGSEMSEGSRGSSGSGDGGDDGDGGVRKGAAVATDPATITPTPRRRLTLSLDTNTDTGSDDDDDDDDDEEGEESFATLTFAAADEEHAAGNRRAGRTSAGAARLSISSYSLSPGPRGVRGAGRVRASVAPGSKSLSPVPRSGSARASWSPGAGGGGGIMVPPLSNCLSPMVRLAPVDHGMGKEGNTVVLELGAWRVRAGVVGERGEDGGVRASYFDDFPCCLASPLREGADLDELVNGASSLAAPMYSKFRESGVFVGGDAWYCCLDHPSIALRSKLKLSCPLQRGQKPTREETDWLVDHAYGLLKQDAAQAPTLLTYKPTATVDEVLGVASVLLESHRVPAIRMVNEAQLSALATDVTTGVLVDIGEAGISVTPIFYGCPVASGVRSEACGGGDVTKYLDYMLLSRTNEQFNQMTDRRRLEYTREVKEEQCYVPKDFAKEVKTYGPFRQKAMRVCKGAQASPMLSGYQACDSRDTFDREESDRPVLKAKTFTLKSGNELQIDIGRERFHAPEIIFQPGLWKEGGVSKGLAAVVVDALSTQDHDSKTLMLGDVVVVGGSAGFEGLGMRLEKDLKKLLPKWLGDRVKVRVPSADGLQHRNSLSRGRASAVTVGAEILLEREDEGQQAWISATKWADDPEVLTRELVPYLSQ